MLLQIARGQLLSHKATTENVDWIYMMRHSFVEGENSDIFKDRTKHLWAPEMHEKLSPLIHEDNTSSGHLVGHACRTNVSRKTLQYRRVLSTPLRVFTAGQ